MPILEEAVSDDILFHSRFFTFPFGRDFLDGKFPQKLIGKGDPLRPSLFSHVTQLMLVVYRRFGAACLFHLQGLSSRRKSSSSTD